MAPPIRLLPGPFTVEMYHKLGVMGVFQEDDRVELLDGQIVEMSPIGDAHARCVFRLTNLLARHSTEEVGVNTQNPLVIDRVWEPQPDIAVLQRAGGFHGEWIATPKDVALIIEVADSSLVRDRDIKIPRYAHEGIVEAWLVDLNSDTITCYHDPRAHGYRTSREVKRGERLQPIQLPHIEISADEILG